MPLDGTLAVDFSPVADPDNLNDTRAVIDRVDHTVRTLSDPVAVLVAPKLFAPGRSGVVSKSLDTCDNTLAITLA